MSFQLGGVQSRKSFFVFCKVILIIVLYTVFQTRTSLNSYLFLDHCIEKMNEPDCMDIFDDDEGKGKVGNISSGCIVEVN